MSSHYSCSETQTYSSMGNSGSTNQDKRTEYSFNQSGNKTTKKKVEEQNNLWIPTPTTTSVFSELDKHSYAAEILDGNLNAIEEEHEDSFDRRDDQIAKIQNGITKLDFNVSSKSLDRKFAHAEKLNAEMDSGSHHRKPEVLRSHSGISKSTEVLTYRRSYEMDDDISDLKANSGQNTIHAVALDRLPQRSSSLRVMKLEAGPWKHQKPSYGELPQLPHNSEVAQRNKVTRRSSWAPSMSRFKKIFLLNKPEEAKPNTRPQWQRSLSVATGEKYYQRTADGHVVAISPESTLRTSQWVAQHSRTSSNSS